MISSSEITRRLEKNYLFAVIRGETQEDGYRISRAAYEGGIKNIELTFSTPNAPRVIARLTEEFLHTDMVVGAGTVLDVVSARLAIINGAKFIVSPTLLPEVAKLCHLYTIPYLPGCATPTEIQQALEMGCDIVKVFPGDVLTSKFIKAIHGPFPQVRIMPSGGVSIENMDSWLNMGAWGAGIGGALTSQYKKSGALSVTQTAKKFAERLTELRRLA